MVILRHLHLLTRRTFLGLSLAALALPLLPRRKRKGGIYTDVYKGRY